MYKKRNYNVNIIILVQCLSIFITYILAYNNDVLCKVTLELQRIKIGSSSRLFRYYLDYWSLMLGSLSGYFVIFLIMVSSLSSLLWIFRSRKEHIVSNIHMLILLHTIILPTVWICASPILPSLFSQHSLYMINLSEKEDICNIIKNYIFITWYNDTYTCLAYMTNTDVLNIDKENILSITAWK